MWGKRRDETSQELKVVEACSKISMLSVTISLSTVEAVMFTTIE